MWMLYTEAAKKVVAESTRKELEEFAQGDPNDPHTIYANRRLLAMSKADAGEAQIPADVASRPNTTADSLRRMELSKNSMNELLMLPEISKNTPEQEALTETSERDICEPFDLEFKEDRWLQWTARVVGIVGSGLSEAKARNPQLWDTNVGPQEGPRIPRKGDGYKLPDSLSSDGSYNNIPMSEDTFKTIFIDRTIAESNEDINKGDLDLIKNDAEKAWDDAAVVMTDKEIRAKSGKLSALRAWWKQDQQQIWNNGNKFEMRNNPQMTMFVVSDSTRCCA